MSDVLNETEKIVKKAKSLGADEIIAKTTFGKYRQSRFSNNEIDTTVAWNDYVTDITLSWKKRVVATQVRNFQNVDGQLKQLFEIAKVSKENPMFGGFAKGKFKYAPSSADRKVAELEDPSRYIFEAVEAAKREAGQDINSGGILFTKFEDVYLASSEGPIGVDSRSAIEFSIRVFSQREASGHSVECSSTLNGFNPSRAGMEAGEIAKLAKSPKVGDEGIYDVVLAPLFAGSMLGMWASMVSAFNIMIQLSIFVNKLEQKVSSEIVSLKDNPAPYSVSDRVFDDEGVAIREKSSLITEC